MDNNEKKSLIVKFADKYDIESDKLANILKKTAFKVRDGEVTNEQLAALLIVAAKYDLNPFTKEIYAFPDKNGGIVPVVGVDGWSRIINADAQLDGIEFVYAEETKKISAAQECAVWMECIIYRKDRAHPVRVREYLEEVYRDNAQPWKSHTKRMLRHKVLIQCARIAFGFVGIYDEDEAERIMEAQVIRDVTPKKENDLNAILQSNADRKAVEAAPAQVAIANQEPDEFMEQLGEVVTSSPEFIQQEKVHNAGK